jgi:hypothetical protein
MKKFFVLISLSLILFSCEEDNGIREVYMVVDVDANNDSEENTVHASFSSNSVGDYLVMLNSPQNETYESQSFSYPVGTNLTYMRLAEDRQNDESIFWAKTRVRIYSNNKKIMDETYKIGDDGNETVTNIILN